MGNLVINFFKEHFYYVLIGCGIFIMIGSYFDWKWLTRISNPSKLVFIREWIEEVHGIEARYKFERFVIFICGLVLFVSGIVYWNYYG